LTAEDLKDLGIGTVGHRRRLLDAIAAPHMKAEGSAKLKNGSLIDDLQRAQIYDLGQPYWWGMPVHPADPPFLIYLYRYHEHTQKLFQEIAPGFADSVSLVTTSMHAGTHMDVPVHMSRNLKVQGHDIVPYQTDKGYEHLPAPLHSIDQVRPLVLRTVLLDICGLKGVDLLPERYGITPDDLEGACKHQGVTIDRGGCVLVRTGYARFFETDPDAYLHKFAGLVDASARWLASKKICLFGIDNLAIGVPKPFECHNLLLTDHGIYVMKNLNLEAMARDRVYESTVFVLPLKIKGCEASLIRPVAIA
jgi:kynurenine formamidase